MLRLARERVVRAHIVSVRRDWRDVSRRNAGSDAGSGACRGNCAPFSGRLYDNYAVERLEREEEVMRLEGRLGPARSAGDREEAARLTSEIGAKQQQVEADLLRVRTKALKALTPVQRAQLQAAQQDARVEVRPDKYFQLLLLPASDIWSARVPSPSQAQFDEMSGSGDFDSSGRGQRSRSRSSRSRGGSYGVYGGYGYGGPQYGVYGNYGQGGVGVHAGIGRGGVSVGIGAGRVFGYGR